VGSLSAVRGVSETTGQGAKFEASVGPTLPRAYDHDAVSGKIGIGQAGRRTDSAGSATTAAAPTVQIQCRAAALPRRRAITASAANASTSVLLVAISRRSARRSIP
jgi:hypothetical protein